LKPFLQKLWPGFSTVKFLWWSFGLSNFVHWLIKADFSEKGGVSILRADFSVEYASFWQPVRTAT
jgi:hypothetical protein